MFLPSPRTTNAGGCVRLRRAIPRAAGTRHPRVQRTMSAAKEPSDITLCARCHGACTVSPHERHEAPLPPPANPPAPSPHVGIAAGICRPQHTRCVPHISHRIPTPREHPPPGWREISRARVPSPTARLNGRASPLPNSIHAMPRSAAAQRTCALAGAAAKGRGSISPVPQVLWHASGQ